ncbi:type IV pilin [Shewanella sp. NFH-SH190041]|uniref:type II secretion system protein n=1 Tax=Shewanella sp. NFH-SH190041 TaxID=2950245 RepID=UPI0021C42F7C|nr:prepilin-type N-terminal cleavage/methylation domain-containing protein [Shewanella sp. NFH-SH190041]BDM63912.1 type IV pilin [Shewanella sp. NFH-SH190041]
MKLTEFHTSKKTQGFTLIELVVTMIILAILAVVASAKFIDFQSDARQSVLKAVGGAMKSSLTEIHALALLQDKDKGNSSITIDGVNVPLKDGYPAVDASASFPQINAQIKAWVDVDIVDRDTANTNRKASVLFSDRASGAGQIFIFFSDLYDSKGSIQCFVRYENNQNGPIVTVATSGC